MKVPVQVFKGFALAGRLNLDDRGGFDNFLQAIGDVKVEVTVRVSRNRADGPTRAQRGFYWGDKGIVKHFAAHMGHTPQEVHIALKRHFLTSVEAGIEPSSEALSQKEYGEYLDACVNLAAEMKFPMDASEKPVVPMPRSARRRIANEQEPPKEENEDDDNKES